MKSSWTSFLVSGCFASLVFLQPAEAANSDAQTASDSSATVAHDTNAAEQAKKKGTDFMETNKDKTGVVTLPSGLQYKVLEAGNGKKPTKNDVVSVDYEGTLLNGEVFDSSYKRGQSASFPVSSVIPGWQEALQLMSTGATWMLYIPPKLAYGEAGAGKMIGPNETLVFKVHLVSIQ